jgi:hypothetical protein
MVHSEEQAEGTILRDMRSFQCERTHITCSRTIICCQFDRPALIYLVGLVFYVARAASAHWTASVSARLDIGAETAQQPPARVAPTKCQLQQVEALFLTQSFLPFTHSRLTCSYDFESQLPVRYAWSSRETTTLRLRARQR